MEKRGFWSRLVNTVFDHNTFRMVLLVMVVLRTCAFLNPIVGPLVKFTLLWSACILVKDLFTDRLFMVNRYRGILYLFLISYAITCVVNRQENFARNLAMLCYLVVNMMVLYSYDGKKEPGQVKRELLRFNHVFMIVSFVGQLVSFLTYFLNLKFSYLIGDDIYYYGVYNGRIWGFYTNPNAASFFSVLNIMLTVVCLIILKGNLPKRLRWFYIANAFVEMMILFMCNSRGSVLALCFYLILLPILMGIPLFKTADDKKKLSKRIVAAAIILPLAVNGAHELAIGVLPSLVIKDSAISQQLVESLPNTGIPLNDDMTGNAAADLEREDYGSKYGGRYFLWQSGLHILENDPLFGVGNDNVPIHAYRYAARYFTNFGDDVYLPGVTGGLHNLFFQIAAASGLVGLGLFVIFGLMVLVRVIRYMIWSYKNKNQNKLAIACICIIATILLRTMTDTGIVYGHYYLGVIFWMYMSVMMYFIDREFPKGPKPVIARLHDKIFRKSAGK